MSGNLDDAWRAIGSLRETVHQHSTQIAIIGKSQDHGQKQYDEMCAQLKDTERELSAKLDILLQKKAKDDAKEEHDEQLKRNVNLLMQKHHETNGAGGLFKFIREIVPLIVGLLAIYSFLVSPYLKQQSQNHSETSKTQTRG